MREWKLSSPLLNHEERNRAESVRWYVPSNTLFLTSAGSQCLPPHTWSNIICLFDRYFLGTRSIKILLQILYQFKRSAHDQNVTTITSQLSYVLWMILTTFGKGLIFPKWLIPGLNKYPKSIPDSPPTRCQLLT